MKSLSFATSIGEIWKHNVFVMMTTLTIIVAFVGSIAFLKAICGLNRLVLFTALGNWKFITEVLIILAALSAPLNGGEYE